MRQTKLVAYKFNTICKDIERESVFLFSIWRLQGFPIIYVPMALYPNFMDIERIAVHCCGKQSEVDVFQKCYSYED